MVRVDYAVIPIIAAFGVGGFALAAPDRPELKNGLEAALLSREKRAVVRSGFQQVAAFRVLIERGPLQLWRASSTMPRPGRTTFKVRGHARQEESGLV